MRYNENPGTDANRYDEDDQASEDNHGWLPEDGTFNLPWDEENLISTDGAADRWGKRRKPPVSAVFIHAGAGYHSTANERIHLEACSEAARTSMKLLRSGHSAIEAVEAAIKILEDKEITNAGYGSNLSIDGTVECDATIVDHFGRSGACGAVPRATGIKNPISLAKAILQSSDRPLSLRRVPPNLLIGDGAKDFAWELGIPLVSNDLLVSRNARDRYVRWQEDLRRAEGKPASPTPSVAGDDQVVTRDWDSEMRQGAHRDHANAIMTGTWNEGQPDSPAPSSPWENGSPVQSPQNPCSPLPNVAAGTPQLSPRSPMERSPLNFLGSSIMPSKAATTNTSSSPALKRPRFTPGPSNESSKSAAMPDLPRGDATNDYLDTHDGASSDVIPLKVFPHVHDHTASLSSSFCDASSRVTDPHDGNGGDTDRITDTVGAIAIDQMGKIAAGSSSGGIGMKHRGRVGPAALVGIGTAVIPADVGDDDSITVAAVTSGTGEHMATTMASQKCAERILHGTCRGPGGRDVAVEDESVILESFILNDFQEHPGVKYSASAGAIGVMAVKKAPKGYYLYFAHNTDSFALASMSSNDRSPACVMSRVNEGNSGVAQGARKIGL
ncbi:N-terminal nucleophile aminohydrolase [Xylariaceae sp. FL0662B]|nr:N-terminal nucleophile aminohydrolase [Xylariaceae sp. FL0662B]